MTHKQKTLERVRHARELLRNLAAAEASAARHALGAAEAAVAEAQAQAQARAQALDGELRAAPSILTLERFAREHELQRCVAAGAERARGEADGEAERRRQALVARERDLRVVERTLDEERRTRHRAEHRVEQAESDDRAGARRARSA